MVFAELPRPAQPLRTPVPEIVRRSSALSPRLRTPGFAADFVLPLAASPRAIVLPSGFGPSVGGRVRFPLARKILAQRPIKGQAFSCTQKLHRGSYLCCAEKQLYQRPCSFLRSSCTKGQPLHVRAGVVFSRIDYELIYLSKNNRSYDCEATGPVFCTAGRRTIRPASRIL